jgi:sulfide:quinone oxidoreductase
MPLSSTPSAHSVSELHELLLTACRFEASRRRAGLPHMSAQDLDDLATRAADDALAAALARLPEYRGESRFSTWAYKFGIAETAARLRRVDQRPAPSTSTRVLIAGGGVAGLETLLALHALAADRVDITLLAPELKFMNRSMATGQPFNQRHGRGLRLPDAAARLGAHWHRGALDRVDRRQHLIFTKDGEQLSYDLLVLAVGARPQEAWGRYAVTTYSGNRDGPAYRLLLHRVLEGQLDRITFVKPVGATWPLPLYDLALMTAADCAAHGRTDVELSLVTPEEQPLGIFGNTASEAVRGLLEESGIGLYTSSYGSPGDRGWLDISPGGDSIRVDQIVTEPRLTGPRLRGIPCAADGFIHVDAHGRVVGVDDVFAAGDATDFPVKQGGLAAQQADSVAEAIAASVGAITDPRPFRPELRGLLLTGGSPRYLRSDISGGSGDDSAISDEALWWPPNKLSGRYLATYLSNQAGEAADVMSQPL